MVTRSEADIMYAEYQESMKNRKARSKTAINLREQSASREAEASQEPAEVSASFDYLAPATADEDWEMVDADVPESPIGSAAGMAQAPPVVPMPPAYFEAAPMAPAPPMAPAAVAAPVTNQWTRKHIQEDHDAFWAREWQEHVRNVAQASPMWSEQQEQEARRMASKARERANAAAPYPHHYRGEDKGCPAGEPTYPFHRGQTPRTINTQGMSLYDQRYGNCRMMEQAVTMPVTFLKHKSPKDHIGLPRSGSRCGAAMGVPDYDHSVYPRMVCRSSATGLKSYSAGADHSREPSGYERAAAAAYSVYQ